MQIRAKASHPAATVSRSQRRCYPCGRYMQVSTCCISKLVPGHQDPTCKWAHCSQALLTAMVLGKTGALGVAQALTAAKQV